MSTDDAGGRIVLDNGQVHVDWPEVGEQPVFARDNQILTMATRALNGTITPDPLWALTSGRSLITVHPLGGCVMADDVANGVVDHAGRVFDPVDGGVHEGLYVCDGSVVPLALDVNPAGDRLVTQGGHDSGGGRIEHSSLLWDVAGGKVLRRLDLTQLLASARFSCSGRLTSTGAGL